LALRPSTATISMDAGSASLELPVATIESIVQQPTLQNAAGVVALSSETPTVTERRYPRRHSQKPRVPLQVLHPGLFVDSDEEKMELDAVSMEESSGIPKARDIAALPKVPLPSRASTSTSASISPRSSEPSTRQTSYSTRNRSSVTPSPAATSSSPSVPALPRKARPPLPARRPKADAPPMHSAGSGTEATLLGAAVTADIPGVSLHAKSPRVQSAPFSLNTSSASPTAAHYPSSQPIMGPTSYDSPSLPLPGNVPSSVILSANPSGSSPPAILPPSPPQEGTSRTKTPGSFQAIVEAFLRDHDEETKPSEGENDPTGNGGEGADDESVRGQGNKDVMSVESEGRKPSVSGAAPATSQLPTPSTSTSVLDSLSTSPTIGKRRRTSEAGDISSPVDDHNEDSAGSDGTVSASIKRSPFSPALPLSPPQKRPKHTFRQHASHWTPEGNVLVQIDGIRFKLSRSRLVKHSRYFRRVLEAQAAGEGDGRFLEGDDAQVIFLDEAGVNVGDFEILLDALDDFLYVYPSLVLRLR
jgi:hypothetical protein